MLFVFKELAGEILWAFLKILFWNLCESVRNIFILILKHYSLIFANELIYLLSETK